MDYRPFADTEVSSICLGTMTWGEQNTREEAFEQMDYALDQGINFFDAAEMYPVAPREETYGRTEEYIGEWFAKTGHRSKVFLASKVTGRGDQNPGTAHIRGGPRLSRAHIFEAVEHSLKRLQTDYLDLYQVHWPERQTNFFGKFGYEHRDDDGIPIAETLEALGELVQSGKVRYIGLSNETPWGVMEYLRLAEQNKLPRVISIQNPYNFLNRAFEIGLAEMAMREQVMLLAYSPLAFGVLSGKYIGGARPEGSRLALFDRFVRYGNPHAMAATEAYVKLAGDSGLDPSQMAIAFVNSRQFTTSTIIGATKMAQLKVNIDAWQTRLSEDVLDEIERIHHRHTIPSP
ncbi:MAG: NADP(H)-dependent aldo-keto reductase [Pseudomonadota bacterium]